ncbi:type I DNA topoisomerase [Leptospira sp. 2 VSF19]|uniref:DNA topoisomerase n=1 Tax=Leptospira soteropolitanensis TaxID=2950025 RepID=A0AAW5VHU9_9LEPT|nr:type I DNA topoisomerase [Leptospira soteropolitanensis]MCW7502085.1 type I DNA topoisomerase [Leptospira soteropolitanensis]MCW7524337.1 type I DNA topoisomerase [Leptospira soteropolitanensis]MCW7528202.1 type I DNA topoisomerase [Leptospira soteropolitanensis]MCW7532055.1 type I DNA topoisomerase [Leptospira soteropolitanensis]
MASYLDKDWIVVATKGHIKDLPPKSYGVDLKNQFEPEYEWLKGKKTVFSAIKAKAKLSSVIYIASDPDREGEIIAKHCYDELVKLKKPIYRLRLKEISKEEVRRQIQFKSGLDLAEIESQIARRVVDRIFGFEVSPDLWKQLKISSLSAGRVQSTVLHWICEREKEIQNFSKEVYYQLKLHGSVLGESVDLDHQTKDKLNSQSIQKLLSEIEILPEPSKLKELRLSQIKKKNIKRNPPPAFSTASLQETSFRLLGFDSKKTMKLAQMLFEGKKIGSGERVGLITYMRTDSTRVSSGKRELGEEYLNKNYPGLLSQISSFPGKLKKHSQDAHEAVIPTNPNLTPDSISPYLSPDEKKLYNLIWERFLVSLMKPELGEETIYEFQKEKEVFYYKNEFITDFGFKAFTKSEKKKIQKRLDWKLGDRFLYESYTIEEKQTEPPVRYTQGKLVQKMEDTGVGRPSTYGTIIETLKIRKYIVEYHKSIGPTALGLKVNDYLYLNFQEMIGESFTKDLEKKLDLVTENKESRILLIQNFYEDLLRILRSPRKKINQSELDTNPLVHKNKLEKPVTAKNTKVKKENISSDFGESRLNDGNICPVCKQGIVKTKLGKKGKTIYFCSRYPHCDYITYEP